MDYVLHQPLRMLIRNPDKLDERECQYAMNILAHTDFLIFSKLDKRPLLVVEVDGYGPHSKPEQVERDSMTLSPSFTPSFLRILAGIVIYPRVVILASSIIMLLSALHWNQCFP